MTTVSTFAAADAPLAAFASEVGAVGPVAVEGGRTRWHVGGPPPAGVRLVRAPAGIVEYAPEEMTVRVRAGTTVAELDAELAARGQRTPLPDRGGTVGGAIAVGENHPGLLGRGLLRASVLQVRYVSADGVLVTGGGPTVKNVTGFDLPRLMVGALGTLGLLAEVILRTDPIPASGQWVVSDDADPLAVRRALLRPGAVLWDGVRTAVLLEGHPDDVASERAMLAAHGSFADGDGWPELPPHRWSLPPSELRRIDAHRTGRFVAVVGAGLVFASNPQPARTLDPVAHAIGERMKANFDPDGRLNPGRDPSVR